MNLQERMNDQSYWESIFLARVCKAHTMSLCLSGAQWTILLGSFAWAF